MSKAILLKARYQAPRVLGLIKRASAKSTVFHVAPWAKQSFSRPATKLHTWSHTPPSDGLATSKQHVALVVVTHVHLPWRHSKWSFAKALLQSNVGLLSSQVQLWHAQLKQPSGILFMLKEASTLARMRQANKTDLSAMAMSTLSKIASLSAWGKICTNSYGRP